MEHSQDSHEPHTGSSSSKKRFGVISSIVLTLLLTVVTFHQFDSRRSPLLKSGRRRLSETTDSGSYRQALFFSYPKSGTSQVTHSVHVCSKTTTATNYGDFVLTKDQGVLEHVLSSIPVSTTEEGRNGPFRFVNFLQLPPKESYILTRTHCTGHCIECLPISYVRDLDHLPLFSRTCGTGTRYSTETNPKFQTTQYDVTPIEKAVILVRNPFDIAVSRFNDQNKYTLTHSNNPEGFHEFCAVRDYAKTRVLHESTWYEPGTFRKAMLMPCHAEFYKIVHWYNMVFETARQVMNDGEGASLLVIKFEDFMDDVKGHAKQLNDFLELPWTDPEEEAIRYDFKNGLLTKVTWFTPLELLDIANFFKDHASLDTWEAFKGYFDGII